MREILDKFNIDYISSPQKGGSVILLIFPYRPFEAYPEGHLFVDNYYVASSEGYRRTNEIIAALKGAGHEAARYRGEPLKDLAVRLGAGRRCKNDLVYTEKYGSYVYFDAIYIKNFITQNGASNGLPPANKDCDLCIRACPNGALSEKGFERGRCLRQFMDKRHNPSEEEKTLVGDRLMGCVECRAACPRNAQIKPVPIPPDLLSATKKDSLNLSKIKEYIGDNLFKKI